MAYEDSQTAYQPNGPNPKQKNIAIIIAVAFLLLLVVLLVASLFSSVSPLSCYSTVGTFLCNNAVLHTNDSLSFIFGQNTGHPIYDLGFSCTAVNYTTAPPAKDFHFVTGLMLNNIGTGCSGAPGKANCETTNETSINNVMCYDSNGNPLPSNISGSGQYNQANAYRANLLVSYTDNPSGSGSNNSATTVQFGKIVLVPQ